MARGDSIKHMLSGMHFMLDKKYTKSLTSWVNEGMAADDSSIKIALDSVTYSKDNNVAVIAIDGATYKKDVSGLCESVASYDKVYNYIQEANRDKDIDTLLFRVDSPGGAVEGVEELREMIRSSEKKTVTFYENKGLSAAVYYGTASDEVYASRTSRIGSIGVIAMFEKVSDENSELVVLSSSRAENKTCDLNSKDCIDKIQESINQQEEFFYRALEENTKFSSEQIEKEFNNGGFIYAEKARDIKFIDGVTTFDKLLTKLKKGDGMAVSQSFMQKMKHIPVSLRDNETLIEMAYDEYVSEEQMKDYLEKHHKDAMHEVKQPKQDISFSSDDLFSAQEQIDSAKKAQKDEIKASFKAKMKEIPHKMKSDEEVIDMAADSEVSLEAFKAYLFDKTKGSGKSYDESDENKKMLEIDGTQPFKEHQAKEGIEIPDHLAEEIEKREKEVLQ